MTPNGRVPFARLATVEEVLFDMDGTLADSDIRLADLDQRSALLLSR